MMKGKPRQETRTEECQCETCGAMFQGRVTVYNFFAPPREFRSRQCPGCKLVREEALERLRLQELAQEKTRLREEWRQSCGIPAWLQARTFANFDPAYHRETYKTTRDWAEKFEIYAPTGYPSLILYSAVPGVGKTHLMVAIANHVIQNWDGDPSLAVCPIRFESGPGLVRRIRATYGRFEEEDGYHEREEDVYNQLRGVKLLMLDDVGKERPSDHTREVYWYIIDERVKWGLPVVISSRLPLQGENSLERLMGVDTVDRLFGMTQGQVVVMGGTSYRRRKLVP